MKKLLLALAGIGLWGVACGEAVPTIDGNTYTFDLSGDDTYSSALSGNIILVKKGAGKLTLTGANAQTGEITIEQGTLAATKPSCFGKMTKITVSSGATLDIGAPAGDSTSGNFTACTLYIAGAGVNGAGAITRTSGGDVNWRFFGPTHLTADATVSATGARWGFGDLYFHGHTLTKKGTKIITFKSVHVYSGDATANDDNARLVIDQTGGEGFNFQEDAIFEGNSNNEIRVIGNATMRSINFYDFSGRIPWTLHGINTTGSRYNIGIFTEHSTATRTNVYHGPVVMEGVIEFQYGTSSKNTGVSTIAGPVTMKSGAWMAKYGNGTTTFTGPVDHNGVFYASGNSEGSGRTRFAGRGVVHTFRSDVSHQSDHVEICDGCTVNFPATKWINMQRGTLATPTTLTVRDATVRMPPGDGRVRLCLGANTAGFVRLEDGGVITNVIVTLADQHSNGSKLGSGVAAAFYVNGGHYYNKSMHHGMAGTEGSYAYLGLTGGAYTLDSGIHLKPGLFGYGHVAVKGGKMDVSQVYPGYGLGTDFVVTKGEVNVRTVSSDGQGDVILAGETTATHGALGTRINIAAQGEGASLRVRRFHSDATNDCQSVFCLSKGATGYITRLYQSAAARKCAATRFDVGFDGGVLHPGLAWGFFDEDYKSDPNAYTELPDSVTIYDGGLTIDTTTASKDKAACDFLAPLMRPTGLSVVSVALPEDAAFLAEKHIGPPQVRIAGTGHGAAAVALYDDQTQKVTGIMVTSPGFGYDATTTATIQSADRSKTYSCAVTVAAQKGTGGIVKRGPGTLSLLNAQSTFGGNIEIEQGTVYVGSDALPATAGLVLHPGGVLSSSSVNRVFPSVRGSGTISGAANVTITGSVAASAEGGIVCTGPLVIENGAKIVVPEVGQWESGSRLTLVSATALTADLSKIAIEGTLPPFGRVVKRNNKLVLAYSRGMALLIR